MSTLAIYTLWWTGLMVIGILNGVLRVMTYQKHMPEIRAHQFSSFTGIIFFGVAVYILDRIWPVESGRQAIMIGLVWFGLTILFEFGFGHFIMKHPWKKLLHDYRVDKGRLWLLVVLWILFAPLFVYVYL